MTATKLRLILRRRGRFRKDLQREPGLFIVNIGLFLFSSLFYPEIPEKDITQDERLSIARRPDRISVSGFLRDEFLGNDPENGKVPRGRGKLRIVSRCLKICIDRGSFFIVDI
jgi:hypothetical protein